MIKKLIVALTFALAVPAWAQGAYPSKPIKVIATAQAGGASDFVARIVADRLSKALGQPVIVDNRAGANGGVGLSELARSPADGYTLAVTIGDSLINNVAIIKNLSYDPKTDFTFITQAVRSPAILSANTDLGVRNMDDFRKLAIPAQKLSYGTWGVGGLGHLAGEALNRKLAAGMVHVPQRGEAPVMADLLSKTVSIGLTSAGLARPQIRAGKVIPLAIMGKDRSPLLPEVATMRELGFDDSIFDAAVWIAFVAPAKTPLAVVQLLSSEIRKIVAMPEVQSQLLERGLEPMNTSPEQFVGNFKKEYDDTLRRMKEFGIEAQ